jgi:hypothetical protein
MKRRGSTQNVVDLERIEQGVVCLRNRQYRAVLEVGSVNFRLQSDLERESIVRGFIGCLNSLTFPVQISIRVLPVDVDSYLTAVERRSRETLSPQLGDLARDHMAFMRRLARNRTLLERHFYVTVPAEDEGGRLSLWQLFGRKKGLTPDEETARKRLAFRCDEVLRQVSRFGLSGRRLDDGDLAELFYACWCPELAKVQRLRHGISDYTRLVVQASSPDELAEGAA